MSLRAVIEENPGWDAYLDQNYQVVGGYGAVAEKMAEPLGDAVHLSSPAQSIAWQRGEVTIDCAGATFRARRAVVTLPVGVLQSRSPAFLPTLPDWKLSAIDALRMGRVVVTHHLFDEPFWRERGVSRWSARSGRIAFRDPHPGRDGPAVLAGWIDGTAAQELSDLGIQAGLERATHWIRRAFPEVDVAKRTLWSHLRDWVSDRYSIGCYSFTLPGGIGQRAILATPIEETLYFAGEATCEPPHYQTVHGAHRSGKRVEREILASLGRG
jgi:monoamine oxidase